MKTSLRLCGAALIAAACFPSLLAAVDPALQAKIDAEIPCLKTLAADPAIIAAVKAHNNALSAEEAAMTQDKWKGLTLLDPFVRAYSKNAAGGALKASKAETVSEAFVSGADGTKVAFLSKPTNWSHKGKPKHEVPMGGKVWQGEIEADESTGFQQIQVGVPVFDGDKPIGVLVVGLSVGKLRG